MSPAKFKNKPCHQATRKDMDWGRMNVQLLFHMYIKISPESWEDMGGSQTASKKGIASFSHDATFSIFSISTGTGIVMQWDCRTVTGAQTMNHSDRFKCLIMKSNHVKGSIRHKRKQIVVD